VNIGRLAFAALLLIFTAVAGAGKREVVLIVRADSNIVALDSVAMRKVFIGLPVLVDGKLLHPVRNRSDSLLDNIFLQQIVAMSQAAYDRQTLGGVMRQGRVRPVEISSHQQVFDILYRDPDCITFDWLDNVERDRRIRVLRVVWEE
jgi:hypothetical protein